MRAAAALAAALACPAAAVRSGADRRAKAKQMGMPRMIGGGGMGHGDLPPLPDGDAAPSEPEVNGDPFTTYNGKRTQFYLPMGNDTLLIACGNASLSGAPVGSGVAGDQQQWFRRFAVRASGVEVLSIEARDVEGPAATPQTAESKAVSRARAAAEEWQKEMEAERSPFDVLTTLTINASGLPVTTTGTGVAGAVKYTVVQDVSRRLGSGFAETVAVAAGGFSAEFASAAAVKLAAGRNMHVDMRFTQVNAAECSGVLPEIWGTSPMSEATAKMLLPPQP